MPESAAKTDATETAGSSSGGWGALWQVPALAGGTLVLGGALVFATATTPEPEFEPVLTSAERLIETGEYERALVVLNDRKTGLWPHVSRGDEGSASPEIRRRYHVLVARAIYAGQRAIDVDVDENHVAVIREYQQAERLGQTLEPEDVYRLADTYVKRGQPEVALARASSIPESQSGLRDRLRRSVIEGWLTDTPRNERRAAEELAVMLSDPLLPVSDRVWALDKRAELQLDRGYADEAVNRLLRAIPRLEGADPHELARLHAKLAQAYLEREAFEEADRHVERAMSLIEPNDVLAAWLGVYRAQIDAARGETGAARDAYGRVVERFASTDAYPSAFLGLAETEATLADPDAALDAYTKLIVELKRRGRRAEPGAGIVTESLLARYLEQASANAFDRALSLVALAGELYTFDTMPPDVLLAMAQGNRGAAADLIGGLGEDMHRRFDTLGPSARAEVQRHLLQAAAYYREHAARFSVTDNAVFADSLWAAAELFDQAGDQRAAIEAYREFVDGNPSDARAAEATYRLALAQQALGRHDVAAGWYEGLIEAAQGPRGADIGPWAVRSYVPLAQAYLRDDSEANDSEAQQLLESAVSGGLGSTGSEQFRDAVMELVRLHYRAREYARAIEWATEAIERYPDDPEIGPMRFMLADSYRLLADEIAETLTEPMPDSEQARRAGLVESHRRAAMDGFSAVLRHYAGLRDSMLDDTDRIYTRNALFYRGDCAFDLGEYQTAIGYYDEAREQYSSDPASLVAMVQIVNAHVELGDFRRARTANERAKRFYAQLPDEVWDDPTLPMNREDWERWVQSSALLYETAGG